MPQPPDWPLSLRALPMHAKRLARRGLPMEGSTGAAPGRHERSPSTTFYSTFNSLSASGTRIADEFRKNM